MVINMTIFEKMKTANIDELAEFLYTNFDREVAPWDEWFEENYCSKCPPVKARCVDCDRDMKFGWCELNEGCKLCSEITDALDNKQVIKLWLQSEVVTNETN